MVIESSTFRGWAETDDISTGWYRRRNGNELLEMGILGVCRYKKTFDGRWMYHDEWDGTWFGRVRDVTDDELELDYLYNHSNFDLLTDREIIVSQNELDFLNRIVT